jgi:hypothetical protein
MEQALGRAVRPPNRLVRDILGPGRECKEVTKSDAAPFYVCNVAGEPMRALPTLMATVRSYAFRGEGQGVIWDRNLSRRRSPRQRRGSWPLGMIGVAQRLRGSRPS